MADTMANNTDDIYCFACKQSRKIKKADEIKVGSHLEFPRCEIPPCYTALYSHHAIVTEVMQCDSNKVSVKLIEYDNCGTRALWAMLTCGHKAFLCCNTKNIDIRKDGVRVVRYSRSKYQRNAVADRAKQLLENRRERGSDESFETNSDQSSDNMQSLLHDANRQSYHLFDNNCEHFATWCVMDYNDSLQAQNFVRGFCTISLSWIINNILLFASVFDGITRIMSPATFYCIVFIPSLIYLVFSLYKDNQQRDAYKMGKLCLSCYNEQFHVLVVRIVLFIMFSAMDFSSVWFLEVFRSVEVSISVAISVFGVLLMSITPEMVFLAKRGQHPLVQLD